ncbi:MAG: hypothetical protein R6X25_10530 [Candidatus Krumholzibacteriia bacterium]
MTRFVRIVASSGTPKLTAVRQTKKQLEDGYDPRTDFWKAARDRIVRVHRQGQGKAQIRALLRELSDQKKIAAYPRAIDGYARFWGRKDIRWFDPVSGDYGRGDITVSVNPELGLVFGGAHYLVKLYFPAKPELSKVKADVVCHVMDRALRVQARNVTMAVLDVGRNRLFAPTVPVPGLDAALIGELAYISSVWDHV